MICKRCGKTREDRIHGLPGEFGAHDFEPQAALVAEELPPCYCDEYSSTCARCDPKRFAKAPVQKVTELVKDHGPRVDTTRFPPEAGSPRKEMPPEHLNTFEERLAWIVWRDVYSLTGDESLALKVEEISEKSFKEHLSATVQREGLRTPEWPKLDPENGDFTDGWNQTIDLCKEAFEKWQKANAAPRTKPLDDMSELRNWKESAIKLLPMQEWGQELDLPLGSSIHDYILPALKELKRLRSQPLEPRCPKCGSVDLTLAGSSSGKKEEPHRIFLICNSCGVDFRCKTPTDLIQFFSAPSQPLILATNKIIEIWLSRRDDKICAMSDAIFELREVVRKYAAPSQKTASDV